MQHLDSDRRAEGLVNEVPDEDFLQRDTEGVDVGALAKSASNFLAFIQDHLFRTRPANGDDPDAVTAVRDDSRPVLRVDAPDHQEPRLRT